MKEHCAKHPRMPYVAPALAEIYGKSTRFYYCDICNTYYMQNFHGKLIAIVVKIKPS